MIRKQYSHILYSLFMIIIALALCMPIMILSVNGFKTEGEISGNPFGLPASFSFSHFSTVWQAIYFPGVLFRTILITCAASAGIVFIASMAAYALQRTRFLMSRFLYPFFVFSLLIPFPSILFPLVLLARDIGLNNAAGIIPIYWGLGCPLAVLIFHGFIKGIPVDWEEAAAMEGAGFFRTFFTIVLPLLKPAIVAVVIFTVFRIWNDFLLPFVLLPPFTTMQLALFGFFIQSSDRWGPAVASLLVTSLPMVIFFIISHKHMIKSISAEVIKR